MPRMMSVKTARSDFFCGEVSEGLLYKLCKENKIPHVKLATGKILFDYEKLEIWWSEKLRQEEPKQERGLRRII